jgi:Leucine-rich repeat (LRR) protein
LAKLFWPESYRPCIDIKYSLDLSFNSIDRIEGLDECLDLEELLLFRNTISKIEGVSMMKKLVIFNLGSNLVKEIEEVCASHLDLNT